MKQIHAVAILVALSIPAKTFAENHYLKWDSVVPRLGGCHELRPSLPHRRRGI